MPKVRRNLAHVIKFEVKRNLKKPTFWIAALLLPLLLVGYIGLAGLVGYNAGMTAEEGSDTSEMTLAVFDEAGYLSSTEIHNADGTTKTLETYDSKEEGIADVKEGKIDVFYVIPADFASTLTAETYASPDTESIFSSFTAPLQTLLMTTANENVDPLDFAILTNTINIETTNFSPETGEATDPAEIISNMIIPFVGLILFYVLIVMFGNRLTTAMVEEKENRISEMILTSMSPKDLITGKIISQIILGFIQLTVLIVPVIILYFFGAANGLIPEGITVTFNLWSILATLALLLFSYFLFTGMCVMVSTLAPTAKDASSFASVLIILVILPLFFLSSFMAETPDTFTYILSYFPPSAPIALMFRNAFGTLPTWELFLGLAVLAFASFLVIKLAVYIYTRTALEFTSRVNLRELISRPRTSWDTKNEG